MNKSKSFKNLGLLNPIEEHLIRIRNKLKKLYIKRNFKTD